jgi:hypothetical protein
MSLKFINLFILFFFSLLMVSPSYAIDTPRSCRGVDLNRYMHTGQPASAPPDKIYKFTEMRAQLLRSIDNSQNTQCYADFYRQAIGEVGDYWGERLAQSGCEVDNRGRITGSCPDAGEARRSVEFVGNLDRELKTRIRARLAESQQAREAAAAAADRDDCEARPTTPARSAQEIKDALCCGTASGGGGVIRAVERGINYQSCIGKTRPTSQSFLSGSGLASCVGNAVKAALQQLWDNITAIFSLPGELWAARSQIWALITQPQARAQFARMLMQQFRSFFTDRVEAFKCYNDYEKAQYVCRMGGQLIATFATPSTIGSFLRLAKQPAAAALRAMSAMLSRSPGGGRIMAGIERANTAARSAAEAATRAGRAVDEASGGRISATARTAGRVGDAIGRPLSAPIERIARSIEGSATFQRLFVNSFRAEKASMGDARPNLATRPDVLEGEVLPPEPRRAAAPSDAPQLERGQIIEGDYVRVVPDDAPNAPDALRLPSPDADGTPSRALAPAPDNSRALALVDDSPSAAVVDRNSPPPSSPRDYSSGDSRAPPPVAEISGPAATPRLAGPADTPRLAGPADLPRLPAPAEVPRLTGPAPTPRLPAPAEVPRLAGPAALPRLPAPAEVPRLPAPTQPRVTTPAVVTRTGPELPSGASARAVTPNDSPTNLAAPSNRGAELPNAAPRINSPPAGGGGGTGFASNSGGGGSAPGVQGISVREMRLSEISDSSLRRKLDPDATRPAPAARNAAQVADQANARPNPTISQNPAPAGNNLGSGTTRPAPARAVADPDATRIRPAQNLDEGSTVRVVPSPGRSAAADANSLPKIEVREVGADQIPDSFWDDLARELQREKDFTIRRTDAARDASTRAESQMKTTPVSRLNGRNVAPEEAILRSQITRARVMGGGVNDTYLVEFANGARAVWKPHKDVWSSNYRAEVLAYEIDRVLGFNLVPPTIVRTLDGQVGSIQYFMNSSKIARPTVQSLNKQHFFDYLIDNRDRHGGNYLIAPNGHVISIDNGLSFTGLGYNKVPLRNRLKNLKDFVKTPEGKDILTNMRRVVNDEQFRAQLVEYLGVKDAGKVIDRMKYLIKIGDDFG